MPSTAELELSFVANTDGSVVFRATRADGSALWQRHEGARGAYFAAHDLMHFAVETVFGTREGFFGLLADGWELAETEGKGARGPVPVEAKVVEQLVGLFDRERLGGAPPLDASAFSAQLRVMVDNAQLDWAPAVTETQLQAVRTRVASLRADWHATAVGEPFALRYTRPALSRLTPGA